MGTLYLVRHGQASFGAANYDQLSPLGQRQCQRLGEYLRNRGLRFEAVWRGSLTRHAQSLAAISAGYGGLPAAVVDAALNEYDGDALLATLPSAGATAPAARTPDGYKAHFQRLRLALGEWAAGRSAPAGMPCHADFVAGLRRVLAELRQRHRGDVLLVSSGGPIGFALADVLAAPAATAIELNLRLRNSALSELVATSRGFVLQGFNQLPHLEGRAFEGWSSYA